VSDYKALSGAIINDEGIGVEDWKQEYGIACSDGFYKVVASEKGGGGGWEKVEYTKELGCRFKLGFKPDFSMKTPLFDKLIDNVENPVLYQMLFGLAVTRYLHKLQNVFTMFGEGGTGKGTTNDIIVAMFPKRQVSSVSLDKLNDEKSVIPLMESQVNIMSEVSSTKQIDTTGIKRASGGDAMTAWILYVGPKSFVPSCSFIMNLNYWIKLKQVGEDVRRRFGHSIVKFEKKQEEQIIGLSEKIIQNELPGVLAWALEGVRLYFEYGLEDSMSLELYSDWTRAVDPIELFFDEHCVFGTGRSVLRSLLYKRFNEFCGDSGYYTVQKGVFFERLNGIRSLEMRRMTGGYKVRGIGLMEQ